MFQSSKPFVPVSDWKDTLVRGDIVLFRYPIAEAADDPTDKQPKRRPCLVLKVFNTADGRFVEVAYGTTADTRANRGYEVKVMQQASCAAAGLDRPTRFVGARRMVAAEVEDV
jgi:hypothetical protein